jgi:hypothetical protein
MSHTARFLSWIYVSLLSWFPKEYKLKFGDEPQLVFSLVMQDAQSKPYMVLRRGMREIIDLLRSLLNEHWRAIQKREANMGLEYLLDQGYSSLKSSTSPPTRREKILVMLPFLAIIISTSLPQLLGLTGLTTIESQTMSILQKIVSGILVLLLLGSLIYAWRTNLPRWSATWFIFFGLLFITPLIYIITLYEDVSLTADVFSEFAGFFLLPLFIALFLYWITRRDPFKGLLAVLPVAVFIWMPNMEFVPDQIEVPIIMLSLGIAAWAAVVILGLDNWRVGLWLVILVAALVGLLYSYAGTYHGGTLPFSAPGPNPLEVLKSFLPQFLAVSTIVLGPFLAVSFRSIGRHSGLTGRISYHLALFGLLLILVSIFANYLPMSDSRMRNFLSSTNLWLNELFLIGLFCYLVAVMILGYAFLRQQPEQGVLEFSLLSLLTLFLPAVLMLPVVQQFSLYFDALDTFRFVYSLPLVILEILGISWMLLAGWLITHQDQQGSSPGELAQV